MATQTEKRTGAVIGGIVLAGAAVIALAAYLSIESDPATGGATGTATTAVSSAITPRQAAAGLYPGATTSGTVTIHNPNNYPVTVTSISAGTSSATAGDCPAGSVTTDALLNPPGVIPPGGAATYRLTATMAADPDNTCQGETFTVPLTATLASAA